MKFLKFIAIAAMLCATPSVVTATPDDGGYTVMAIAFYQDIQLS